MRGAVVVGLVAVLGLGCGSSSTEGSASESGEQPDERPESCLLAEADIPDFEQTWAEAVSSARSETCDGESRLRAVALGECDTGLLIVSRSTGLFVANALYDPETAEFVAVRTGSDSLDGVCDGGEYWPVDAECNGAEFTEFVCGPDGSQ